MSARWRGGRPRRGASKTRGNAVMTPSFSHATDLGNDVASRYVPIYRKPIAIPRDTYREEFDHASVIWTPRTSPSSPRAAGVRRPAGGLRAGHRAIRPGTGTRTVPATSATAAAVRPLAGHARLPRVPWRARHAARRPAPGSRGWPAQQARRRAGGDPRPARGAAHARLRD